MRFVCVQPSVTSLSRRTEDLTPDKTDEKDAVLIARLTAQLRCCAPEPVDETWGRLRHLGARREQLLTSIVSENVSGRARWTPRSSRSGRRPGPRRYTLFVTATAAS
jgi:hypothetical protein